MNDLWEAYFYNNIFGYGKGASALSGILGLLSGGASMLTFNDSVLLLVFFSLLVLFVAGKKRETGLLFGPFLVSFIPVYYGGRNMKYYSEILGVFVPISLSLLWVKEPEAAESLPASVRNGKKQTLMKIAGMVLLVAALFGTDNRREMTVKKEDLPQTRFAARIAETPNATLFNYGSLDIGQYTVSDIFPSCRYFCMLNLPSEEMIQEVQKYMWQGATDYIVSRDLPVETSTYELIDETVFEYEGGERSYYLYQRKT